MAEITGTGVNEGQRHGEAAVNVGLLRGNPAESRQDAASRSAQR